MITQSEKLSPPTISFKNFSHQIVDGKHVFTIEAIVTSGTFNDQKDQLAQQYPSDQGINISWQFIMKETRNPDGSRTILVKGAENTFVGNITT